MSSSPIPDSNPKTEVKNRLQSREHLEANLEYYLQHRWTIPEVLEVLGMTMKQFSFEYNAALTSELQRLLELPLSAQHIATQWGMVYKTIVKWIHAFGLDSVWTQRRAASSSTATTGSNRTENSGVAVKSLEHVRTNITYYLQHGWTVSALADYLDLKKKTFISRNRPAIIEEIKRLLLQNQTAAEVSRTLDMGHRTVNDWIKRYHLEEQRLNNPNIPNTPEKKVVIQAYLHLKGIDVMQQEFHTKRSHLRPILDEAGFKHMTKGVLLKAQKHITGNFWIPFSPRLHEIITGELLGDASLELKKVDSQQYKNQENTSPAEYLEAISYVKRVQNAENNISKHNVQEIVSKFDYSLEIIAKTRIARFRMGKAILEEPWVKHLSQLFQKYEYPTILKTSIRSPDAYNPEEYEIINIRTKFTTNLSYEWFNWYQTGMKRVPRDIPMTPDVLLHWFIGDGSTDRRQVILCTDGFLHEDTQFLAKRLGQQIGGQVKIREINPDQYRLAITYNENLNKFFTYLNQANPKTLAVAKRIFPWKFSRTLRKKDVIPK